MGKDIAEGYALAAKSAKATGIAPAGLAWNRAMETGVADDNPYDGIAHGKIDLWTHDSYHASAYGYYLEALLVFGKVTGKDPLLDIALELERIALEDDYFVKRRLYPNVDFYSGIIYQAMRFPVDMFPVMFAIPRTSGWLAQWVELLEDPDQKIARPRQVYLGNSTRDYVPIEKRREQ